MIIDGHAHACGTYLTPENIEKYLVTHGIDKVVLCGGEPNSSKNYVYPMLSNLFKGQRLSYVFNKIISRVTKISNAANNIDEQNEFVYNLSCQLPQKVINAYWVNPLDDDCIHKLKEYYPIYKFKMIKLHQCWTNFDISCEQCTEVFEWATAHNLPIFIHLLSHEQVVKFVKIANKFKDTTFIVAHMIGADCMNDTLKNENVYFDLSAPQLYSIDILNRTVKNFGVQRLLLGSDTPYGINNIDKVRKKLIQLSLSDDEITLICGDNLAKLLSL